MQAADKPKFVTLVQALAAAFKTEPTPALLEAYWLGLDDMDLESLERAVRAAIRTSKFMPTPSELRGMSGGQTVESAALHAWGAVRAAVRAQGIYQSVDFGPLVNAVVRNLGGWQRLCNEETEQLDKWVRKDFERVFTIFADGGVGEDAGKYLVGLHERDNAAGGFKYDPPVFVAIEGQEVPRPKLLKGGDQ